MPYICHTKLFEILVWIFITNDDVNNENLDLHGRGNSILTMSTMDMVSKKLGISIAQILIALDVWSRYVFKASKENRVS